MTDKSGKKNYNSNEVEDNFSELFENLPDVMRVQDVSKLLGVSTKTIYNWKYAGQMRNIPESLFIKINRLLYVNTRELRKWITLQN